MLVAKVALKYSFWKVSRVFMVFIWGSIGVTDTYVVAMSFILIDIFSLWIKDYFTSSSDEGFYFIVEGGALNSRTSLSRTQIPI